MTRLAAFVDHSVYAASVCDHAAWLAAQETTSVDIIHVINPYDLGLMRAAYAGLVGGGPSVTFNLARRTADQIAALRISGQRLLETMAERIRSTADCVVTLRLAVAEWPDVLVEMRRNYDLVVIGKRGENADFVRLDLGSTLEQVATSIDQPILAVPRLYRSVTSWLIALSGKAEQASGVANILKMQLLPTLPCTILHAGDTDPDIVSVARNVSEQLQAAGHSVSIDAESDPLVQTVANRMVTDEIGLLSVGGFRSARLFPTLFGEGAAAELTRACLTPVLILR